MLKWDLYIPRWSFDRSMEQALKISDRVTRSTQSYQEMVQCWRLLRSVRCYEGHHEDTSLLFATSRLRLFRGRKSAYEMLSIQW
jgi:hypothetical protein